METASYFDIIDQAPTLPGTVERARAVDLRQPRGDVGVVFTGCGASYHAATAAALFLSALGQGRGAAVAASDLWMNPELWLTGGTTVVGLSRTGTTTETIAALRTARSFGATTIGVSLTGATPVVDEADASVVLDHVGEQGRVMTRSFTNLLLACQVLGIQAAEKARERSTNWVTPYAEALEHLAPEMADAIPAFKQAASTEAKFAPNHVVFLGSGPGVGLCRQAALQTQETARRAVEAHAVLDYRHGPLAALTPESLVVVLTSRRSLAADLMVAEDLGVLGGTLVAVGPPDVVERFPAHVHPVPVPTSAPLWLQGDVAVPFLQLLAYQLTTGRDADPESVANLDRTKTPHVNPHVLPPDLFPTSP